MTGRAQGWVGGYVGFAPGSRGVSCVDVVPSSTAEGRRTLYARVTEDAAMYFPKVHIAVLILN